MSRKITTSVNGILVDIDPIIESFTLYQKPSSHIQYFGVDSKAGKLFVQFNNGTAKVFSGVPAQTLAASTIAISIGAFLHASIYKKFDEEDLPPNIVVPSKEEDNEYDPFENNYDEGWDSL